MISASCDPLPTPFPVWLQVSSIPKFVCETREAGSLFVLIVQCWTVYPKGRVKMCIGSATHLCRENPPHFFMLKHGNWLHNSFPLPVSHWKWRDFLTWCGCVHSMRLHMCCICLSCALCAPWCAGGQGPCGGCALVYTHIYTDQEKWSVNHITYIVVYIE